MKTKICFVCQEENPISALVCRNCGSTFTGNRTLKVSHEDDVDERITQLTRTSPDTIVFLIEDNEEPLVIHEIQEIILGRSVPDQEPPTIDLNKFGGGVRGVSRRHAQIQRTAVGYIVRDLHSTNGTLLNGSRLVPDSYYALHNGDKVQLGKLSLTVYFSAIAEQRTIFIADTAENNPMLHIRSKLSPQYVATTLGAFLRAMADLQRIIDEIKRQPHLEVGIGSINITQSTMLISVQLEGGTEALYWVQNRLTPWKRQLNLSGNPPDFQKAQQLAIELAEFPELSLSQDEQYLVAQRLIPIVQALVFSTLELVDKPEK